MIEIDDIRKPKDFQGITFSNFKKSEAKRLWIECILESKVEESCYWCLEFLCAGHFLEIWEIFFLVFSKYIHIRNPKCCIYMYMRYETFRNIITSNYIDRELEMRNDKEIRKLYIEINSVLTLSNRSTVYSSIKVDKNDMNILELHERLKSPSLHYSKDILHTNDAKELIICINEFCYHISSESLHSYEAIYWLEWIFEYLLLCKRKKTTCTIEKRETIPVHSSYQTDPIWMFWISIQKECKKRCSRLHQKIIDNILQLFCIRYTSGVKRKRKFLLYFAIMLITDYASNTLENKKIIENTSLLKIILEKQDTIMKQIKQNEKPPKMNYLFKNVKESSKVKSMKKMQLLEAFENGSL